MLRQFAEIIPFYFLITILRFLPFEKRVYWGGLFCKIFLPWVSKYYKRVNSNLKLIFPEMSLENRKNFISENSKMIGESFIELMFNREFQSKWDIIKYNKKELASIIEAKKIGRPVMIISGHIGSWEAVRAVLKKHDLTSAALYQRNKNIFYEKLHYKAIKEGGEPILEVGTSGTRKMISLIRSGGIIALMIDQAVTEGTYFQFLGKPAKTSTSIAEISIKYNALIVPAYGIREVGGNIRVSFDTAIKLDNVHSITDSMNKSLEKRIEINPTQWYWPHRRWK
jgi:KDO2-lipid IV(A) lauroyltransferase